MTVAKLGWALVVGSSGLLLACSTKDDAHAGDMMGGTGGALGSGGSMSTAMNTGTGGSDTATSGSGGAGMQSGSGGTSTGQNTDSGGSASRAIDAGTPSAVHDGGDDDD